MMPGEGLLAELPSRIPAGYEQHEDEVGDDEDDVVDDGEWQPHSESEAFEADSEMEYEYDAEEVTMIDEPSFGILARAPWSYRE